MALTKRQQEVLDFTAVSSNENGLQPSYEEERRGGTEKWWQAGREELVTVVNTLGKRRTCA